MNSSALAFPPVFLLASMLSVAAVAEPAQTAAQTAAGEAPPPEAALLEGPCFARFVPERKDDFAWENDRVAFRMYGPTLGKEEPDHSGSGIDVWVKSVRYPIINKWYAEGGYHRDHGEGLDFYKVGTTRGCGGLGVWNGSGLDTSGVYAEHRVIEGEGDAVEFELAYDPWTSGEAAVSEVKRIRMEQGENLFTARSTFDIEGAETVTIGVGITLRKWKSGNVAGTVRHGDNWMAYAEPKDRRHGRVFCAVILPEAAEFKQTDEHLLLLTPVEDGETLVYRAGASWDKGLDFKTAEAWFDHVAAEAMQYAGEK